MCLGERVAPAENVYFPRLDWISSHEVWRVRQCQQGWPSAASHFTRLALHALQATRARRRSGEGVLEGMLPLA